MSFWDDQLGTRVAYFRGIYLERGILHTALGEISLYGMQHSHLPSVRIRRSALRDCDLYAFRFRIAPMSDIPTS